MSRLDSRGYRWFVLCVPPQKELAVQKIMDREGFASFVPVSKEYKFVNGVAKARAIKTEVALPIMPRYVFLGMNDSTPGWERVFCFTGVFNYWKARIVTGVIGVDGRPCEVRHEPLRKFMLRHDAGKFNAPSYHRYMRLHQEFEVGDKVITEDELFAGKVVDIRDNRARVFVEIFGGGREVDIALENLVVVW